MSFGGVGGVGGVGGGEGEGKSSRCYFPSNLLSVIPLGGM